MSSNKVEGVNSALKKFLRKHNGFTYDRVWLALEEFIYHKNNSGSAAFANIEAVMRHVGSVGSSKTALRDAEGHSVFWEYQQIWQKFCVLPDEHLNRDACDCVPELPEVEEEVDD